MINLYITEEEIEECYEETENQLQDVPWPTEHTFNTTLNFEINSTIIQKRIEHNVQEGRIITPDNKVYPVHNGYVQFENN